MSSSFIKAALKLEGSVLVDKESVMTVSIAGPTVSKSYLRTFAGSGSSIMLWVQMPVLVLQFIHRDCAELQEGCFEVDTW